MHVICILFSLHIFGPKRAVGQTQDIASLPVVTRDGAILSVGALADIIITEGPTLIRHVERERTVTLEIRPAAAVPLEVAMQTLEDNVISAMAKPASKLSVATRLGNLSADAVFCPVETFTTSRMVCMATPWPSPNCTASLVAAIAVADRKLLSSFIV